MTTDGGRGLLDIGSGGQMGDVTTGDSAAGNIYKPTIYGAGLREIAEIMWKIDARMDAQREQDAEERQRRQNEIDLDRAATRQALEAIRRQLSELRAWLLWLSVLLAAAALLIGLLLVDRALIWFGAAGALGLYWLRTRP